MSEMNELSGNIKLRLPKTLHSVLISQAKEEGVSLNQLCLMYLSHEASRKNTCLGTENFNRRLVGISMQTQTEEEMFQQLDALNDEVEMLKPLLLGELKRARKENKRNMIEFVDILSNFFPIYFNEYSSDKMPLLKVPSAKIVIEPDGNFILDYNSIRDCVELVCLDGVVAWGDYDYFQPLSIRLKDQERRMCSLSINVCCDYKDLKKNIIDIKKHLLSLDGIKESMLKIRPCYLQLSTARLLIDEEGI